MVRVNVVKSQPQARASHCLAGFDSVDVPTDPRARPENVSSRCFQRFERGGGKFFVHLAFGCTQLIIQANKKMCSIFEPLGL